ncbi:MAG: tetratricopeptide repeat protein [bacterium]|nr:tetratricopeptide repeat protein [bacterium]
MKKNTLLILLPVLLFSLFTIGWGEEAKNAQSQYRLPYVDLPENIIVLLKGGQWEKALTALEAFKDTYSTDDNLDHYLTLCYGELGAAALQAKKYNEAIEKYQIAVNLCQENPAPYLGLGYSHMMLSDYQEAEDAFLTGVDLAPNNIYGLKMLGQIYYLTDDLEQAVSFWERALKIDDTDKALQKQLRKIKKQLKSNKNMETELDNYFTVRFDGEKIPQLRDIVLTTLQDIHAKIGQELNLYPRRLITVTLMSKKQFFDITGLPGWAGGVYEGQIKIPVENYKLEPLKVVLCHEYIHAVLYDALSMRCPWWLHEGMAQYFSGDMNNSKKLAAVPVILRDKWSPSLLDLPGDIAGDAVKVGYAYALSLSAVDYFIQEFSTATLEGILDEMTKGREFAPVLEEITSYTFKEFQTRWKESKK